jgi:hypothetical protein
MISQSQAASYAYQAGFTGTSLNYIVGASTAQGNSGLNTLADFQKAFSQTSGGTNLAAIPEFKTGTAQAQTYDWWSAIQQGLSLVPGTVINNPGTVLQSTGISSLNPVDAITSFVKSLAIPTSFVIIGVIIALVGLFLIIMTPQHVQTITGVAKDAAAGAALAG